MISAWNEEKTRLLDALIAPSQNFIDLQRLPDPTLLNPHCQPRSCLDPLELVYAQELRHYNELLLKGSPRPNLIQKFAQLSQSFGDSRVTDMWTLLVCVSQISEPLHSDPIKSRQQRPEFVNHAKSYLERRYRVFMRSQVGGSYASNNYQLVLAYVSHRFSAQQTIGLVDTVGDRPLWPLVYYGLRCGSADTAVEFLREAGSSHEEFAQLVADRNAGETNSRIENQLRLQYANKIRNSTDAYKKAVYCILLGCDVNEVHGEVAKTIDDFLWMDSTLTAPQNVRGSRGVDQPGCGPPAAAATGRGGLGGGGRHHDARPAGHRMAGNQALRPMGLRRHLDQRHLAAGLHRRKGEVRPLPAALRRTLCGQAVPQGPVPHRGAPHQWPDDEGPQ